MAAENGGDPLPGLLQTLFGGDRVALRGWLSVMAAAALGRFVYHVGQVQRGLRRFWSLHLVWEVPMAIGMGILGNGVADAFGFADTVKTSLIAALAWLGPRGLEAGLYAWLGRRSGSGSGRGG